MGDKGGKGFSLPKSGGKSTLKTPGKDDRVGRKVQFEDYPNSNGKVGGKGDNPFSSKGDWGKGGKGGKAANGGKSAVPKKLELNISQELPKNAKCLMDCEAAEILQGIHDEMVILSSDPSIKIPAAFDQSLQYAKKGCHYSDHQSVRRVLDTLKEHGVSEGEICVIANTCPESVNEVIALLPSLKGKKEKLTEPLTDALSELAKLKQST